MLNARRINSLMSSGRPSWVDSDAKWQINTTALDNRVWTGLREFGSIAAALTDGALTFGRASTAYQRTAGGIYTPVSSGILRLNSDWMTLEGAATNKCWNSLLAGEVDGTPGTVPTNTTAGSSTNGLTRTLAHGTWSNNMSYVEYRLAGTTTATATHQIALPSTANAAASPSDSIYGSIFSEVVSSTGLSALTYRLLSYTGTGSAVIMSSLNLLSNPSLARQGLNGVVGAGKDNVQNNILISYNTGTIVDFKLRLGLSQLELNAQTSPIDTPTGSGATRAADALGMSMVVGVSNIKVYFGDGTTTQVITGSNLGNNAYALSAAGLSSRFVTKIKGY